MPEKEPETLDAILARLSESPDDGDSWAALYRELRPFVLSVVMRLGGRFSLGETEEICSDVFCRLAKYCEFSAFQDSQAFRNYLFFVCRNTVRSCTRSASRVPPTAQLDRDSVSKLNSPIDEALAGDLLERIVKRLLPEQQSLLSLIIDGYSPAEIAVEQATTYSNAAVRIHRLRCKIREILEADTT